MVRWVVVAIESRPSRRGTAIGVAITLLGFFLLTGVTTNTDCAHDGKCGLGIPLRWSGAGNAFAVGLVFALDLALFLSLVPAARAVQSSRSRLGLAYLILIGVGLAGFTAVNWSGRLGLRIAWRSLF